MTDNVNVLPSTDSDAVSVATDAISNIHYPIYKAAFGADGSVTLIDDTNGMPVNLATDAKVQQEDILLTLGEIKTQLKIMNMHLSVISDMQIGKGDL